MRARRPRYSLQIQRADEVAFFGLQVFEAFANRGKRIVHELRRIGDLFLVDRFDAVVLGQQVRNTDRKLLDIIVLRVFLAQFFLEQRSEVFILRNPAGRGLDGFHIAVDPQLGPQHPDHLVQLAVEELAVVALEEVVRREDRRDIVHAVGKVQIVLDVLAQRNRRQSPGWP